MERIAEIASRAAQLQQGASVALPSLPRPGAFAQALGAQLEASSSLTAPRCGCPCTPGGGRSAPVTLGQMLGLPPPVTLGQMRGLPPGPSSAGLAAQASVAPAEVAGPPPLQSGLVQPVQGRFTSGFGPRIHPVTGARKMHAGVDIAAPTGTPFRAVAAGRVTFAGSRGGYGQLVILDHGDGTESRYAHASRLDVRVGQQVSAGTPLGAVGSTGLSTGPHLHFEFRRAGQPVDPAPLLGLSR